MGLIIYVLLSTYSKDSQELGEVRVQLDPADLHPVLSGGLLREAIVFNNYCTWEFDDTYLPYPSDDLSCGSSGWAHRYSQVLERSIFKGIGENKARLIEVGHKMAFGTTDEFYKILNLGARRDLGLSPLDFVELHEGTIEDKPLMTFLGLNKSSPYEKYVEEWLGAKEHQT